MVEKRLHLLIRGRVQGVFYRASSRDIAVNLSLTGWAKNNLDGSVEIIAEGDENDLKDFLKWAKKGPENAEISEIKEEWLPFKDEFDDFEIRYSETRMPDHDDALGQLDKLDNFVEVNPGSDHPLHEPFTKEKPFKE